MYPVIPCRKKKNRKILHLSFRVNTQKALPERNCTSDERANQINTSSIPELLSSISGNNQIPYFSFNRIVYLKNRYALFTDNGVIKLIAGLSPADRITDDAVKLTDGVDNFIMNYGNSGLDIVNKDGHRI